VVAPVDPLRDPALERESPLDASGQPCWDESLSTTIVVSDPSRLGRRIARPPSSSLVELRVADKAEDPAPVSAAPTATPSPCPSEPLEISTPGASLRSGW